MFWFLVGIGVVIGIFWGIASNNRNKNKDTPVLPLSEPELIPACAPDALSATPKPQAKTLRPRRGEWVKSEKGNITTVIDGYRLTVFMQDGGWKYCAAKESEDDDGGPYFSALYDTEAIAKQEALKWAEYSIAAPRDYASSLLLLLNTLGDDLKKDAREMPSKLAQSLTSYQLLIINERLHDKAELINNLTIRAEDIEADDIVDALEKLEGLYDTLSDVVSDQYVRTVQAEHKRKA